jgi:hypothetical protein
MIKTLNSCHFDQELREKALYCEPLTNLLPNFELKLCFGFHYGSAIEGAHFLSPLRMHVIAPVWPHKLKTYFRHYRIQLSI